MSKNTGGPAFPATFNNDSDMNVIAPDGQLVFPGGTVEMQGMTLRDYFAAQAMQSLLLDKKKIEVWSTENDVWQDVLTTAAYFIADGMLAARGAA